VPPPAARSEGIDGRLAYSQPSVSSASGTTAKKAPRQPMYCPRKLPSGAATVVASALPPFSSPIARGTSASGTRRMTVAADIDQKPPITTPTSARPAMKTPALGASATITPETSISAVRRSSTRRRSIPRVADEMPRLVRTAKIPETAIAWPRRPSLIRRSAAMGVSRLTGMNSDAISVATHRVSANTAPHPAAPRRPGRAGSGRARPVRSRGDGWSGHVSARRCARAAAPAPRGAV
jgi:hypothetical protein